MNDHIYIVWTDGEFSFNGDCLSKLKNLTIEKCLHDSLFPSDIVKVRAIENGEIIDITLPIRQMLREGYRKKNELYEIMAMKSKKER